MFKAIGPGERVVRSRFAIQANIAGMIHDVEVGIGALKEAPSQGQVPGIVDVPGKLSKYRFLLPVGAAF